MMEIEMIEKKKRIYRTAFSAVLLTALAVILFAALPVNEAEAARKLVRVDGSSTVFPITEAVAEEFQAERRGKVMVTVGISGTGGGFKKFCRGEIDVVDASREIKASEAAACKEKGREYIELSIAYDGIAVMVNPKNDWVDSLTVKELKKIWEPAAKGKIMKWSDVRSGWPDKELRLFGPGVASGTFDYFTKVISGAEGASRGDFTASEDDNVLVQGISTDPYALGFFGLAYYEHNKDKLKLVAIDDFDDSNGKGPILPSLKTVNNLTYQPLSRPIFIYVAKDAAAKEEVDDFIIFYLENAALLSAEVGYIPLPDNLMNKEIEKFNAR